MRSKVAQRILNETPQETKNAVREFANKENKMKNPEEYKSYIEVTIQRLEGNKEKHEKEMLENFQKSFRWGGPSDIFKLNVEIRDLKNMLNAHEVGEAKAFMNNYISSITEKMMSGRFVSHSTNEFRNIAERLELEVRCEVAKQFKANIDCWF